MVNFFVVVVTFLAATASGAPIKKRINQIIVQSMTKWQDACVAAGASFADVCNPQAIKSFDALLANEDVCDQQDQADAMMKIAHNFKDDPAMIFFTQIYRQQPRNSPSRESVPDCQRPAKDPKLQNLFACQFAGVNPNTFVGGIPVGAPGTFPFNQTAKVDPPGSCPAHPNGPIPDGQELNAIVQIPDFSKSSAGSSNAPKPKEDIVTSTGSDTSGSGSSGSGSSSDTGSGSTSSDFHLENGTQAQQLNAKFANLNAKSPCTAGENACIGSQFAQCVGKFVTTSCGALDCYALPLVNKPGTSVACTTKSDAEARIAATGAQGGISGSGS